MTTLNEYRTQLPDNFNEILKDLTKSAIEEQPDNIYEFAEHFFKKRLRSTDITPPVSARNGTPVPAVPFEYLLKKTSSQSSVLSKNSSVVDLFSNLSSTPSSPSFGMVPPRLDGFDDAQDTSVVRNRVNKEEFFKILEETVDIPTDSRPMFVALFNAFDKDNDGTVDKMEMAVGYTELTSNSHQDSIRLLFDIMDKNHDQKISLEEYLEFYKNYFRTRSYLLGSPLPNNRWNVVQDYLVRCFKAADTNENGELDMTEILKATANEDSPFSDLIDQLDSIKLKKRNSTGSLKSEE
mmetsp:Transcript_4933/g.7313  ORF Transcript_4933/g.7313 Transcript_4933/m.7313 type:complete len:294 (+) Transcript_4933:89-970(+)